MDVGRHPKDVESPQSVSEQQASLHICPRQRPPRQSVGAVHGTPTSPVPVLAPSAAHARTACGPGSVTQRTGKPGTISSHSSEVQQGDAQRMPRSPNEAQKPDEHAASASHGA